MLERVAKYSLTIYEIQPFCLAFILYNYYKSKVKYLHHMHTFSHDILKVLESNLNFYFLWKNLFFMQKIPVSLKKICFKYYIIYIGLLLS